VKCGFVIFFLARIHSPRDKDTGHKKNHSFVVLSNVELVKHLVKKGLVFDGQQFNAFAAKDYAEDGRIGITKKVGVHFSDPSCADEVEKELVRVAGQHPLKLRKNPAGTAMFASFDSPDTVVKVMRQSVLVTVF
jgi:hypothetical protein